MAAVKEHKPLTARGRFWQRRIQRWRQSGLSQAQYCRQQRLSCHHIVCAVHGKCVEENPDLRPRA